MNRALLQRAIQRLNRAKPLVWEVFVGCAKDYRLGTETSEEYKLWGWYYKQVKGYLRMLNKIAAQPEEQQEGWLRDALLVALDFAYHQTDHERKREFLMVCIQEVKRILGEGQA